MSFAFNQKFFEQFLPYFLFEKLASAGRQDFVDTLTGAAKPPRCSTRFLYFRGNISLLIMSMYLEVAWYTPGKVLMGRPWEALGMKPLPNLP